MEVILAIPLLAFFSLKDSLNARHRIWHGMNRLITIIFTIKRNASFYPKPSITRNDRVTEEADRLYSMVKDVCDILRTQTQWQEPLKLRLFSESVSYVHVILILKRLQDVKLGFLFFNWVAGQEGVNFKHHPHSYSAMLKLLAGARMFEEAEQVFESMRIQGSSLTEGALNELISAYSEAGLINRGCDLFVYAKNQRLSPSVFSCNRLLDALVKGRRMAVAEKVYSEMAESEKNCPDEYSTGILIRGLCREGRVCEARVLMQKACVRNECGPTGPNVVFYNTLMDGYCKKGEVWLAFGVFGEMIKKGVSPNVVTYGTLVNGLCKEENLDEAGRLLIEIVKAGLRPNECVFNAIIDGYCKQGNISEAGKVLNKMVDMGCVPDVVTYNSLISGLCESGKMEEAQKHVDEMLQRCLVLGKITYTSLIHGHCKQGNMPEATNLLIGMLEKGHQPDVITYGALIHGLCVLGKVSEAFSIRDKMVAKGLEPDTTVYNALISGLCKKGLLADAKKFMIEMLEKQCLPNDCTYVTVIDGYCREGKLTEAVKIFNFMLERGIEPGIVGYNAMIKGYSKLGMMEHACSCVVQMLKKLLFPNEFTFTTLIDGYCKQKNTAKAMKLLNEMVKRECNPDVVTYSALINGYCKEGKMQEAWALFQDMQEKGLVPNEFTYSTLIHGYCKYGNIVGAIELFDAMLQKGCVPNEVTSNILISGLCKASSMQSERLEQSLLTKLPAIFYKMLYDDWDYKTAAYNTIIMGFCVRKKLQLALTLKDKMSAEGFMPDGVTYAALLHGLCQEDKVNDVNKILSEALQKDMLYGAIRYSILIDQFFGQGKVSKATLLLNRKLGTECGQRNITNVHEKEASKSTLFLNRNPGTEFGHSHILTVHEKEAAVAGME